MRIRTIFLLAALGTWWIDQGIKELFLGGYQWQSRCLSLELHLNRGVAFSLFAFLGPWLKWLQILLIGGLFAFFLRDGWIHRHPFALGILLGAALGNLWDRFAHGAVVDYVYWHCGFDFAVFNYADVMIDLSVAWLLLQAWWSHRRHKEA
ncbi:MAG TPA: lipoprotein signal peptidase [Nitratifractor salsuginis]|uniref:Lipoprotein signal peptidase n=1 Tax=Nitratifractor salsuginis TaxID=269261 RepID=A0A7V2SIG4_9BACT|nr:lipoprotein signal peptidase [Nitratifractor salsuginis]